MSKKTFTVVSSHLGNCVQLAGNANAGVLLYRIYCRSNKSTFKDRNGEKGWAVLHPDQWSVDTGLSVPQYHRALRKLKDQKLIIWKNQFKGKPVGNPPLWAKVSDEIREEVRNQQ